MTTRIILVITVCILGQSCSRTDEHFEKLLKSPEKYHRQEIEITGTFHQRSEDAAIYLRGNSPVTYAVCIEYVKVLTAPETFDGLDKIDGQKVKIKGKFDKDDKGHLGGYAGTVEYAIIEIYD